MAFVAEDGAVDSGFVAQVDELFPDEHGIAFPGSQADVFSGADELFAVSASPKFAAFGAGVMAFIQGSADRIGVVCYPPYRIHVVNHSEVIWSLLFNEEAALLVFPFLSWDQDFEDAR